ncbi:MAG: hypothetical protein KGH60_03235 [Candidatus Micrarchaeota archaeon]|nr:hypothetical protein [Candidatus Micrarchaeota archaeon]
MAYKSIEFKPSAETDREIKRLCADYRIATPMIMMLAATFKSDQEAQTIIKLIREARPDNVDLINLHLSVFNRDIDGLKECILSGKLADTIRASKRE